MWPTSHFIMDSNFNDINIVGELKDMLLKAIPHGYTIWVSNYGVSMWPTSHFIMDSNFNDISIVGELKDMLLKAIPHGS